MLDWIGRLIEFLATFAEGGKELYQENPLGFTIAVLVILLFLGFLGNRVANYVRTGSAYSTTGQGESQGKGWFKGGARPGGGSTQGPAGGELFSEKGQEPVQLDLSGGQGLLDGFLPKPKDDLDTLWEKDYGQLEKDFVDGFARAVGMNQGAIAELDTADKKMAGARQMLAENRFQEAITAANQAVKSNRDNLFVHTEARTIRAEAFRRLNDHEHYNVEKQKAGALNYLSFRYAFPDLASKIENSDPKVAKAMPRVFEYFDHVADVRNKPLPANSTWENRAKEQEAEAARKKAEWVEFEKYATEYEQRNKRRR